MTKRAKSRSPPSGPRASARIDYAFRTRFRVPAAWAFRWCIDYSPNDMASFPNYGTRRVRWLSDRTVELHDSYRLADGRWVPKVKLVQIYPEERRWVSNHVEGPNHHSQFRYRVSAQGPRASILLFQGRELHWGGRPLSATAVARLARQLRSEDSEFWRRLAAAMEQDYRSRSSSTLSRPPVTLGRGRPSRSSPRPERTRPVGA